MFRSAERIFRSGERIFRSGERIFRSAEYKSNTAYSYIRDSRKLVQTNLTIWLPVS